MRALKSIMSNKNLLNAVRPIFDGCWYTAQYDDVREQVISNKTTPIKHYIRHGIYEGRSPNFLFDFSFYLNSNSEYLNKKFQDNAKIVLDFLNNTEAFANSPHPLFDPQWYLAQNEQARVAVARKKLHPYLHFLEYGSKEGLSPNSMFDARWYIQNYPEARSLVNNGKVTAIQHYLLVGGKLGFSPSALFDARWYLDQNEDVADLTRTGLTDALSHYLSMGRVEGRSYREHKNFSSNHEVLYTDLTHDGSSDVSFHRKVSSNYSLSNTPLVSILIVNLNGERHLSDLAASLLSQSYRNFEVVFVDNGSSDRSCELWQALIQQSIIVKLGQNVGFAEANNVGLRHANGELIALLNNDTKVDYDWLYSLVNLIRNDPHIGAVTSKVRFWEKFSTVELTSDKVFFVNANLILTYLKYKKYFVDTGKEDGKNIEADARGDVFKLIIKLPSNEMNINLHIIGSFDFQIVTLKSGHRKKSFRLGGTGKFVEVPASEQSILPGKYVINNAGSIEGEDYTTGDRGFGSYDEGQFETVESVSLLCGCSCLIRRDALRGSDIFIGEFFAYFEDSELSQRLRRNGFKIFYCPSSKIYHKHSSTSIEKSYFWMKYVNRNQVLYKYILSPLSQRSEFLSKKLLTFNHHKSYFANEANIKSPNDKSYAHALDDIIAELPLLAERIDGAGLLKKNQIRIGVYNDFWQTFGGGEAHALSLVSSLCAISTVELISRNDFDLDFLLPYFGVKETNIRKRIVFDMIPEITAEYDIFVNSTYMSECESLAQHSFYLVSFPSKTPAARFLSSYKFFANSEYTLKWMNRLWGKENFESEIFYPAVSDKLVGYINDRNVQKSKIIISVGRFFASGHSKNQHIISEIYKKCIDSYGFNDWKLILVGSSNDDDYVQSIVLSLSGYNASVFTNVSLDELSKYYKSASIYIHASGYGKDEEAEPENFEHFGMTVLESAMNGCLPIVYNKAGPKEIVNKLAIGDLYETVDEAVYILINRMKELDNLDQRSILAKNISSRAQKIFQISSSKTRRDVIADLFKMNNVIDV